MRSGAIAGVLALAVAAGYVAIIASENEGFDARFGVVLACIVAAGVCALAGAVVSAGDLQAALRMFAAPMLLSLGIIGLFSIGLPLLIAGLIELRAATAAMEGAPHRTRIFAVAGSAGLLLPFLGLWAT